MISPHLIKISTDFSRGDLLLKSSAAKKVKEIENWLLESSSSNRQNSLQKKLRKGYRALFTGPDASGKTSIALKLGKEYNRPVYRIDLANVVSKYIGETEKNLESIFKNAENKNWILFFDEANALFGKRTGVKDSHDKYANQETAYLFQKIEDYNGLIILATNMKSNIDDAFIRRFHTVVPFS